jgi:hypothetical protein
LISRSLEPERVCGVKGMRVQPLITFVWKLCLSNGLLISDYTAQIIKGQNYKKQVIIIAKERLK